MESTLATVGGHLGAGIKAPAGGDNEQADLGRILKMGREAEKGGSFTY